MAGPTPGVSDNYPFYDRSFVCLRGDYNGFGDPLDIGSYYHGTWSGGGLLVRDDGVVLGSYCNWNGGGVYISHVASEAYLRTHHNSLAANEFLLDTVLSTKTSTGGYTVGGPTHITRLLKTSTGAFLCFVYDMSRPAGPGQNIGGYTEVRVWACTNGDGTHVGDWSQVDTFGRVEGASLFTNQGLGIPLEQDGGIAIPIVAPNISLWWNPSTHGFESPGLLFGFLGLYVYGGGADGTGWDSPNDAICTGLNSFALNTSFTPADDSPFENIEGCKGIAICGNGHFTCLWETISPGYASLLEAEAGGRRVNSVPYPPWNAGCGIFTGSDGYDYLVTAGGAFSNQLKVYRRPTSDSLPTDDSWITGLGQPVRTRLGGDLLQTPGIFTDQGPGDLVRFVEHGYEWITYQAVNGTTLRSPSLAAAKATSGANGETFDPEFGVGVWGVVYSQGDFYDFGVRLGRRALALGAQHVIVDAEECFKFTEGTGLGQKIIDGLRAGGWTGAVHLSTLGAPSGGGDFRMDIQPFLDTGGGVLPQAYANVSTAYEPAFCESYWTSKGVPASKLNYTIGISQPPGSTGWPSISGQDNVPLLAAAGVQENFSIFMGEFCTEDDLLALDEFTAGVVSSTSAVWEYIGGPIGDDGTECIWVSPKDGYPYFFGTSIVGSNSMFYCNGNVHGLTWTPPPSQKPTTGAHIVALTSG